MIKHKSFSKAFTLLELIFVIVIISTLASFALPKFFNTKTMASVAVIKQDIASTISSLQTYSLTNGNINKISDVINLNSSFWQLEDKQIMFKDSDSICIKIEIKQQSLLNEISLEIFENTSVLCKKLFDEGIQNRTYDLY